MARWLNWSSKLEDDRGVRFSPRPDPDAKRASLRLLSRSEAAHRAAGPVRSRSAGYRVELLQRNATMRAAWLLVVPASVPLLMIAAYAVEEVRSEPVKVLLFLTLVIASLAVYFIADRRRTTRMRRELPTLPPACLACRYELAGIPPADSDGCTVCPECGAAWDFETMA